MGAKADNPNASVQMTPLLGVGTILIVSVAVAAAGKLVVAESQGSLVTSSYNEPTQSNNNQAQTQARAQAENQQNEPNTDESQHTTTEVNTSVVSSQTGSVESTVTINGETIDVPASGTIHRTMTSGDNQSQVDISIQADSSAGSSSQSSHTSVNTNTHSSSVQYHSGSQ